jgi:hypothetical protein
MAFLLSEDKALREKLTGMTVTDQKADELGEARPVGVWFGQPDQEIRSQSYPYITIDMIDMQRDVEREMRGISTAEYLRPDDLQPEDDEDPVPFLVALPIPVNIDYQITSYSRHPRHDRSIMSQLLSVKLPIRFGTLELDDNTVRRLDVLDVSKRDITEQGKRLFINAITVRVSSEIAPTIFTSMQQVLSVHLDDPTPEREGGRPGAPYFYGPGAQVITD